MNDPQPDLQGFLDLQASRAPARAEIARRLDDLDSGHRKVNKIRHEASNYDYILNGLIGPGSREAYKIIKIRFLDLISKEYPELGGDCDFQRETHEEKMDEEEDARCHAREQYEEMRKARNLSRRVKRLAA